MFCCPGLMSKQYYWPMSVTWSNGFVKVHPMICMSAFNQRFTHQKLNSRTLYEQQLLGPNDITTTSYIHLMAFFSRTIWVSQHQKGKPFCILMKQEMMGRWWGGSVCVSICLHVHHMPVLYRNGCTDQVDFLNTGFPLELCPKPWT